MPRTRRHVNADGLRPWVAVAEATGLSERQVKRVFVRAMAKVRIECERRGIGYDEFAAYMAARDTASVLDLPTALIPDGDMLAGTDDDDDA